MSELTLSTKIIRNPDVAWRVLGDYLVAITPEDNKVHRCNATGVLIWQCLENGARDIDSIKQVVEEGFDTDGKSVDKDIVNFIEDIHKKGLVKIEE